MRIKPLDVRKAQRLFSVVVLLGLVTAIAPQLASKVEVQFPTPTISGATKLMIFQEGYNIEPDRTVELTIRAVDEEGSVDTDREDLVELNITSLSYITTRSELSSTTLKLQNGTATVLFTGHATEMVRVTANWKDGKSELKPGMLIIHVGVGGE